MSGTLNKVMLIGHTGDEVKMHYFEGGNCVGRFPLATNDSYVNKATGERVNTTEWHNIVVRNKAAEICEKYLAKGDKVYIEGRLKTRKWQDEQGKDRYSTEIQCTEFTFLTPKADSPGVSGEQKPNPTNSSVDTGNAQKTEPQIGTEDDDLPF
ncbi:single-stranded DNA-binding protein [Aquimarina intermedia]|uniref:Single-stranded DNA-binding protein n=1 Tax=Aquimarina intermedia TaxID=350814 RepID=A0A5S5CD81_9FLAO|nr:single-stranded DNA-binding protein [Aquimarina intermedia]TYP77109.1 single-strand binding protein [Aquimarina intermedia]